ncbi:hypothetical protein WJX77_010754 [Trebouxia sp. C0004]
MVLAPSICAQNYVVERHLCTKTPYEQRQSLSRGNSPTYLPKYESSQPLFTYWLARHGTRWPTKKRMQQIQELQNVFKLAGQDAKQSHSWINKWTNPFKDSIHLAGHLHPKGVKEMQHMGQDFKKYLVAIQDQDLLTSVEVHATAKARTQDSAKAFMQGLYGGTHTYTDSQGKGGITGHDRVVNVTKHGCNTTYTIHARPKHQDPVLRFFDMCPAYDEYVAHIDADFLDAWKLQEWCAHIPRLAEGLGVDPGMLTGRHVDALWHLCQQEAGLWSITNRACSLFPPQEAQQMEWVNDVQLFMRKGAASPVAYHMAAPLLADIATSLQEAAAGTGRSGLHAKLSFAHAETIIPLACLLGLFGTNSNQPLPQDQQCNATVDDLPEQSSCVHQQKTDADVQLEGYLRDSNSTYTKGEAMQSWAPPLPKPPKPREWHGSMIAPYGANIQLNLYPCQESQTLATKKQGGGHCIEVLYNGMRVELPGCHHTQGFCSLKSFLEITQSMRCPAAFNHACRI